MAAAATETPTKSGAQSEPDGISDAPVSTPSTRDDGPTENIFLFWPNLIGQYPSFLIILPCRAQHRTDRVPPFSSGYFRIVLAVASLYYMPLHPRTCSLLYSISCLLDALDGYAARYFNQSTRFGAVLDMVTDRCTTSCLLVFLSSAFPRWAIVFQGLISLDFASHYIHMYATLAMGGSGQSHKNVDKSRSWLLNLYYTNKVCSATFEDCRSTKLTLVRLFSLSHAP